MSILQLQPGDIMLVGGGNSGEQKASSVIRKKTTSYIEMLSGNKTIYTHTGIISSYSPLYAAQGIEMTMPKMRKFWIRDYLNAGAAVGVYRIKNLKPHQKNAIVEHMRRGLTSRKTAFHGGQPERYGTWKLITYALSARLQWYIDKYTDGNAHKWLWGAAELIKKLDLTHNYFCSQWVARAIDGVIAQCDGGKDGGYYGMIMSSFLHYSPDDLHDLFTRLVRGGIMELVVEKNK